jgi:hypothetical protein
LVGVCFSDELFETEREGQVVPRRTVNAATGREATTAGQEAPPAAV